MEVKCVVFWRQEDGLWKWHMDYLYYERLR
jgi:hypothetical protein